MLADIQDTDLFHDVADLYNRLRATGSSQVSDVADVRPSPDGRFAVFAGGVVGAAEGIPPTRICRTDLTTGETLILTSGPNVDRAPRFSPDGRQIAFLSDRHKAGEFQLHLLDPADGIARETPFVFGWVEYLHWSPDGAKILLGVAGHGADVAGGQGAITSKREGVARTSWMPAVETGEEPFRRRTVWIYDVVNEMVCEVPIPGLNIWEATWCGNDALAVVASSSSEEGAWYKARLFAVPLDGKASSDLYQPRDQLGWPAGAPSGHCVAFAEAVCSDRWLVAGDLLLIDFATRETTTVDTKGLNITSIEWRSDDFLLLAGHRGASTAIATYVPSTGTYREIWESRVRSTGGRFASVAGYGNAGDCVFETEGFAQAPTITALVDGRPENVCAFDHGYDRATANIASRLISWSAPDGLAIEGWLIEPDEEGPHATVMYIHGGPVYHWRPVWLARSAKFLKILALVRAGYAVFLPNPRGSSCYGRDFARLVQGDMGGDDTFDYLSGLDALVAAGVTDPDRIGVTGGSYGGYMAAWLICQDSRFKAAVPVVPMTNNVTQHLLSNIPEFVDLFLADSYRNLEGRYFSRSPIMHAHKARTPTLNICGALDRCTPPEEAVQFHNCLRRNGVSSMLVTYPEEGHGIQHLPAAFDYVSRAIAWFRMHMPAKPDRGANQNDAFAALSSDRMAIVDGIS